MAVAVPRALVDRVLLGAPDARRQLQDSPILGDVWARYAAAPDAAVELLVTPFKTHTAGQMARLLVAQFARMPEADPDIAFLQGVVAARMRFEELLQVVVPMTAWWHAKRNQAELEDYRHAERGPAKLERAVGVILAIARQFVSGGDTRAPTEAERLGDRLSAVDRYVALAGLILWAQGAGGKGKAPASFAAAVRRITPRTIVKLLTDLLLDELMQTGGDGPSVFQVSLNRAASAAIGRSALAVKADAARQLFHVACKDIAWAVIDSGIDASHAAFLDAKGECRVVKALDFSQFRRIVSLSNEKPAIRARNLEALARSRRTPLPKDAGARLERLAKDAGGGRRIDWDSIEALIAIDPTEPPASDHGTHVAGIIGANGAAVRAGREPHADASDGMCPDIRLYDLRVLAPNLEDTEFAVIAALQYIRQLNERRRYITIHGANLSLSIPHAVRNYACGRTPVCLEAESLVDSGVVVVAAAGNYGHQRYLTEDGPYEGYATLSITDPGNAEGVITVGSTHRDSPHTYGVSFFSSRGPTGDGRAKPDLVAPGERIRATLPGDEWGDHDGTSMAAPHASGAAAMLMARHAELVGQPRRIKRILCDSATDLGRERNFQGCGMLDVLRALQSV